MIAVHLRDLIAIAEQQVPTARAAAHTDHQALLTILGQIVQDPGFTGDRDEVESRLNTAYEARVAAAEGWLAGIRNALSFVDQPSPAGDIEPHRSGLS